VEKVVFEKFNPNQNFFMEAYCVKCKAKREISGPKEVAMKGKGGAKRRAMTGTCPKCGTKMFRILGKDYKA
jgi:Zn finger protein HypA/HybF involved in hydrogenase expression